MSAEPDEDGEGPCEIDLACCKEDKDVRFGYKQNQYADQYDRHKALSSREICGRWKN